MKDISATFGTVYKPIKTLVVYEEDSSEKHLFVESYDMDNNGFPINAHPLTLKESMALAKALDTSEELERNFLKPSGLMPKNVLHINPSQNGYAVWHTPAQQVELFFTDSLTIPNGNACVPPLIWRATKNTLWVFALIGGSDITETTSLYHAPFFNLYPDGRVCMGTVKIKIPSDCLLDEFIALWQQYFFNSYFSHLIGNNSPVKGNIIQLWQGLIGTKKKFPVKYLLDSGKKLKHLLK